MQQLLGGYIKELLLWELVLKPLFKNSETLTLAK